MRILAPIAIGLLLAAAFVACAIDPNPPPDPPGNQGRIELLRVADGGDGGEADQ